MKTVFLAMRYGKPAALLLQSGLAATLASHGLKVVILAPLLEDGSNSCQAFAAENVILEPFSETVFRDAVTGVERSTLGHKLSRQEQALAEFRKGFFAGLNSSATLNIRYNEYKQNVRKNWPRIILFTTGKRLGVLCKASPWLARKVRSLLNQLSVSLISENRYRALFRKYKPSLVVTLHDKYDGPDVPVLRRAAKDKVPSIAIIRGWDNLTSRGGELAIRADKLAVWNTVMQDEAVRLHGYKPEDVFISGPLQFDSYFKPDCLSSREEFFRKVGADPSKKLLTYTAWFPEVAACEPQIVEMIDTWIREKKLAYPCQILVRPRGNPSHYKLFERFDGTGNVILDRTPLAFRFPEGATSDALHLANTLRHSDVVLNIASTIAIEACIFDTPLVNIAFDGYEKKKYIDSIAKYYDFSHYASLLEMGGMKVARDQDQLLGCINDYLKDPQLDGAARRRIAEVECRYCDGTASERIANYVTKVAER